MQEIKILIVEDDLNYALELEMLVDKLGYKVLGIVDSAKKVFEILKKETPDLILMDIQINGELSGIEIAKQIENEEISVIFITNFNQKETFDEANTTNHFGYIVKPFNHFTLESTIEVALINSDKSSDEIKTEWDEDLILKEFVFIKKRNRLEKVAVKDIKYLEAEGNYCLILTDTEKFILKISLKKVVNYLGEKHFLRISKSHVINLKKISRIIPSENKILIDEESFLIGRKYKSPLINRLQLLK